jgi:hypothetical protein
MASETGSNIFARARTIATQTMSDANVSQVIDSLGGLRALLNHSIREVYRRKSTDQKFAQDIVTVHTIAIGTGTGVVPDEIMREFLQQANITDNNGSLVSYMNYAIDASNETFDQLGYVWITGDTFNYKAPAPDLSTFSGSLFVTVQSFPEFPASMSSAITFPSTATIDDIILFLSQAILGKEEYQLA